MKRLTPKIETLKTRFRKRFPKRDPIFYDGELHQRKYVALMAVMSLLLYLYIETFARATIGIFEGVKFLFQHPIIFLYNALIIFASMTVCLLFKKRRFVLLIISLVWILLGTVNGMILIKRMTPFTLYDVKNVADGLTILTTYYSKFQIIVGLIAIVLVIIMLVMYFINSKRWKNVNYKKSALAVVFSVACCLLATSWLLRTGTISTFFGNLNYAYRDYGFPYCFINTSVNKGISRPDNYSEESIDKILMDHTSRGLDTQPVKQDDSLSYPNVIVLQMESFAPAQDFKHISVDKDPTPVFTELSQNYTSGWFEVPACGAGTANTEFEVLTGVSAKFFGPGEYPYKDMLRKHTMESLAYVLKDHGFETSALHNHRALFYNRNEVYANLGFDSYTSIEYMNNIAKTPTGWAKDELLTGNIMDIMQTTPNRDFMHVISVEGHGSYPIEQVFKTPYTTVTCDDEETKWKYEYYLNEVHEMDTFIGDLIDQIEASGEPTIMIIYGDHIPALDVKESEYGNGDLYQTRYVIWDNIGLPKEDKNISAYESGAILLEDIGLSGEGVLFDYQQTTSRKDKGYIANLKALSYDMLYGDNFVFGGKNPYERSDMRMGFKKIEITDIVKVGDEYYIRGKNFTEHSSVSLDGKVLDTVYLSSNLLSLKEKVAAEDVKDLKVSQIDTKDNTLLTTTGLEEL